MKTTAELLVMHLNYYNRRELERMIITFALLFICSYGALRLSYQTNSPAAFDHGGLVTAAPAAINGPKKLVDVLWSCPAQSMLDQNLDTECASTPSLKPMNK